MLSCIRRLWEMFYFLTREALEATSGYSNFNPLFGQLDIFPMSYRLPSSRGKPFQSKLLPIANAILSWRRSGYSFGWIRAALIEKHGIVASRSTIHSFVMTLQKRGRGLSKRPPRATAIRKLRPAEQVSSSDLKPDPFDAVEALRRKKPAPSRRPAFKFDETKPLTLKTKTTA